MQAVVLGLIQGLTEFLPVSSSGHLIAVRWLLGWEDPGLAFDVALHMGTLVAVLIYFRLDWLRMARAVLTSLPNLRTHSTGRQDSHPDSGPGANPDAGPDANTNPDARLAWYILLATIPGAVAGALGEERLEELFHGTASAAIPGPQVAGILIVGVVMIVMAGLLWLAERTAKHTDGMAQITLRRAMLIGLAQAFAIIPGVSRSGSTITAGLFMNLRREAAARFSFLLGTPIVLGAGLKQIYDLVVQGGLPAGGAATFVAGFLAAAISGYGAIFWLLRFLQHNSTLPFVAYRIALGVLLVVLALASLRA